jgi:hypothetical protein
MSETTKEPRSTCEKCGRKRYRSQMRKTGLASYFRRRFTWVCDPSCDHAFYKGQPTKATKAQLNVN